MRTIKVTLRRKVTAIEYATVVVPIPEDRAGLTASDIQADILHIAEKHATHWLHEATIEPIADVTFTKASKREVAALCSELVAEENQPVLSE